MEKFGVAVLRYAFAAGDSMMYVGACVSTPKVIFAGVEFPALSATTARRWYVPGTSADDDGMVAVACPPAIVKRDVISVSGASANWRKTWIDDWFTPLPESEY